jgi:hypothetical protein
MNHAPKSAPPWWLVVVGLSGCGTDVVVGASADHDASVPASDARVVPVTNDGMILCGAAQCGSVDVGGGLGLYPPCCFALSQCGALTSRACVELNSPGAVDPECPSLGPNVGCCRLDGTCGIIPEGTLFGCVTPLIPFVAAMVGSCTPADH